jgi:hypothetical protein
MRRITVILAGLLLATGMMAGSALAMQPPGGPAQQQFGCVEGRDAPVAGHPGAAGLTHATPKVAVLTGNPQPTAWNAVTRAAPVTLGGC